MLDKSALFAHEPSRPSGSVGSKFSFQPIDTKRNKVFDVFVNAAARSQNWEATAGQRISFVWSRAEPEDAVPVIHVTPGLPAIAASSSARWRGLFKGAFLRQAMRQRGAGISPLAKGGPPAFVGSTLPGCGQYNSPGSNSYSLCRLAASTGLLKPTLLAA